MSKGKQPKGRSTEEAEQFREVAGEVGRGQNTWGLGNQVEEVERPSLRGVGYH